MSPVTPVTIAIDGVERELRFTHGAAKRIVDTFGMSMRDALNKYDAGAFPGILHALMYDRKGQPPNLTVEELGELLPMDGATETMAAIIAAMNQGKIPKEQIEAMLTKAMEQEAMKNGFGSGLFAGNDFDSPTGSSGGDTPSGKLTLLQKSTEVSNESETPAVA